MFRKSKSEQPRVDKDQQKLDDLLNKMRKEDMDDCIRKFETAYFIAKIELPMTKYKQILDLEEHHKVPVSNPYRNSSQCGIFVDYMADDLARLTAKKIANANFLTFYGMGHLTLQSRKGLTICHAPKQAGRRDGKRVCVETERPGLQAVEHAHAQGVFDAIDRGFQNIGKSCH